MTIVALNLKSVVLDKNWVYTPGPLARLASERRLLFTHVLFYEILTADPAERSRCIANLVPVQDSLILLPGLGELLTHEAVTNTPLYPLERHPEASEFVFHKDGPDYAFSTEQLQYLEKLRHEREVQDFEAFKESCVVTSGWFPDLKAQKPGGKRDIPDQLTNAIATDHRMVRELYGAIRKDFMPSPDAIDPKWLFFRWMQVHLLAGVDFIYRYGHSACVTSSKLPNDFIDLEYLVIGLVAGAFATREKRLRRWFRLLSPEGELLPS